MSETPRPEAGERRFPVLAASRRNTTPPSVPWRLVAPHAARAQVNHSQTLERLAERGGLAPDELWCVVHEASWNGRCTVEVAEAWLSGIADAEAAAPCAPAGPEPSEAAKAAVEKILPAHLYSALPKYRDTINARLELAERLLRAAYAAQFGSPSERGTAAPNGPEVAR